MLVPGAGATGRGPASAGSLLFHGQLQPQRPGSLQNVRRQLCQRASDRLLECDVTEQRLPLELLDEGSQASKW